MLPFLPSSRIFTLECEFTQLLEEGDLIRDLTLSLVVKISKDRGSEMVIDSRGGCFSLTMTGSDGKETMYTASQHRIDSVRHYRRLFHCKVTIKYAPIL